MVSAVLTSIHLTSSDEPRSTEVQRLVGVLKCHILSWVINTCWCFPTRSDTNRAVQPLEIARILKFRIKEEEE